MQINPSPICVNIPTACRITSLGRDALYDLIRQQKITAKKAGRRTLVLVSSLEAYIDSLPTVHQKAA